MGVGEGMPATEPDKRESARRRDRRVAKTRSAIAEAFWALLGENEFAHVTISGIARTAAIDRKTFYLHYRSIDDLLAALVTELIGAVYDTYELMPGRCGSAAASGALSRDDLRGDVGAFFNALAVVCERSAEHVRLLVRRVPTGVLFARLCEAVLDEASQRGPLTLLQLDPAVQAYVVSYFLAGTLALLAPWLDSDEDAVRLTTLTDLAADLATDGLCAALDGTWDMRPW